MSVKKWRQLAEGRAKLDNQTEEIHQKFKMDKINKEFGQLSGEEFFKPITKRLDENSTTVEEEEEEEQEFPDYTMDEFDETYPFGDEFRPDAPTPAPSPAPSPTPSPTPPPSPPPPSYQEVVADDDDFPPPPPQSLMEEKKSTRKEWGVPEPVKKEYSHESTLLQTVNQLITKFGNDPNYKVKSKKSPLHGLSVEQLKEVRDGIYGKRGVPKTVFEKQLQVGKYRLKSTPPQEKRETTPTPLEKAVMSRRPAFELSDDEDDFSKQDWETEGSGIADEAEKLIDQLHFSLGAIKAGNSSIKLKKQVLYLLDSLVALGTIDKKEKKKIISDYIKQ